MGAARKLKGAREVLREVVREMEMREESIRWIDRGGWDTEIRERRAARECAGIVSGFERMCDGWGQRILAQDGGAIGVAI